MAGVCSGTFPGYLDRLVSMSIARNTGYNLLGTLLPIVISLATVPVYLRLIGLERYGILSTCWLLLGYFGLFDLGLGRAVTQRIAALVDAPPAARSEVFWTAFWISVGLMVLASLLLLPVAQYLLHLVRFQSAEVASEVDPAAPWLAITLPVSLFTGILNGALTGRERFGLLNLSEILANSLSAIVPLAVAYFIGTQLWMLIAASLLVKLLSTLLMLLFCRSVVPLDRPSRPSGIVARSLIIYGGWVSVTSIVGPMLAIWDRFAVGWYLGAAAVSLYVIPFTFVMRLTLVPSALSRALFPRFAALPGGASAQLHRDSLGMLSLFMTPATIIGIWMGFPFLGLWLGRDIAVDAAPVMAVLLPGVWFNGMAQIVYSLLQAQDRPSTVAKIHLLELVPYVIILFAAMYWLGLVGVAAASSIRSIADAILLFRASKDGLAVLKPFTLSAATTILAALTAVALSPDGIPFHVSLLIIAIIGSWASIHASPNGVRLAQGEIARLRRRLVGVG